MLISILSMSVEPLEMSCAESVDALAPQAGDFKVESLVSDVCLQESSSTSVISFVAWPDLDWVSLL